MLDAATKKLREYFIGYLNFVLHGLISIIAGGSGEGLARRRGQVERLLKVVSR
jgi:hypothetical protein